jgi:hypothetical protein
MPVSRSSRRPGREHCGHRALGFYTQLRDTIAGRIVAATTVEETTTALRSVLRAAWLHIEYDGEVRGEFLLRTPVDS